MPTVTPLYGGPLSPNSCAFCTYEKYVCKPRRISSYETKNLDYL